MIVPDHKAVNDELHEVYPGVCELLLGYIKVVEGFVRTVLLPLGWNSNFSKLKKHDCPQLPVDEAYFQKTVHIKSVDTALRRKWI